MLKEKVPEAERPFIPIRNGFWNKIKSLLFGQISLHSQQREAFSDLTIPAHKTTLHDWTLAVDIFGPLVHGIRDQLDLSHYEKFDLEVLGISTYLYHIDRLLVKIREHFLTYRYRQDQFDKDQDMLSKPEFLQVGQACEQCYHTILHLTHTLQSVSPKKLYSDDFISEIHALELDAGALGSAVRSLNQLAYRQEAIEQITTLERNLLQGPKKELNVLSNYVNTAPGTLYSPSEYLRSKLPEMVHPEHISMVAELIGIYETLKKCYVVARKMVVKETLDTMGEQIENMIKLFSEREFEEEKILSSLHIIYNKLESLRFSSNRESRCSRNLFEKTKLARHILRSACRANPIGREFIKEISVERESLIKK